MAREFARLFRFRFKNNFPFLSLLRFSLSGLLITFLEQNSRSDFTDWNFTVLGRLPMTLAAQKTYFGVELQLESINRCRIPFVFAYETRKY